MLHPTRLRPLVPFCRAMSSVASRKPFPVLSLDLKDLGPAEVVAAARTRSQKARDVHEAITKACVFGGGDKGRKR